MLAEEYAYPVRRQASFDIVVIAASLGGPEAVREIVAGLPATFPAAIIVVQHRAASADQVTVDLLRRRAQLPVRIAADGIRPLPGVVDVASGRRQLLLGPDGAFVSQAPSGNYGCAANPLLAAVAARYGARAIAVILSGMQEDGAAGIVALKRQGGWVLAQDHATARCFAMPAAAIATGCVDFVLPVRRIADALVTLTMQPGAADLFRVPSPFWA